MCFGITKTIPQSAGIETLNALYDGSILEFEFHKAGGISKLSIGDYVYTIFNDQLVGRLQIIRFREGELNPDSGKPRTLIYVACPGERLHEPIAKKGHRGTRYYEGEDWPSS